jgi:mannosyl-oligosaccharide alpha-1,2-mannosidase
MTAQFISKDGNYTGDNPPSVEDQSFYEKHGFYIADGSSAYVLRPEVLESNFYAFRTTGDEKYLQRAWKAFESMRRVLGVNGAFTCISDVNRQDGGRKVDDMPSFFFSEVLKYLYLTFDEPERVSLDECTPCSPLARSRSD